MDYVKKNQDILDEWRAKFIKEKQCDESYNGWDLDKLFADDGIMNKGKIAKNAVGEWRRYQSKTGKENNEWSNAPLRVLFLSKDENLYDYTIPAWDVRTETFYLHNTETPIYISNSPFYRNEACLLYGLLHTSLENGKIEYNDITWDDALRFADEQIFARINCKKEGGGETCHNNVLQNAIKEDSALLEKQIKNLDADIFVCCGYSKAIEGSGNLILNFLNTIGYNFRADKKESWIYYDEENNKIAINSYHLSYPGFDYEGMINAYFEFLKAHPDFTNSHR